MNFNLLKFESVIDLLESEWPAYGTIQPTIDFAYIRRSKPCKGSTQSKNSFTIRGINKSAAI